jgi:hypothetical protein
VHGKEYHLSLRTGILELMGSVRSEELNHEIGTAGVNAPTRYLFTPENRDQEDLDQTGTILDEIYNMRASPWALYCLLIPCSG